jgi:ABC-2 type transport system permease protein
VELAVQTRGAGGADAPGADVAETGTSGTEGAADATVTVRTERFSDRSVEDGRILVLSTSELTTAQMLNPQNRTPNGTFLLNALDYLNGVPEVAALRSKGLGVPRITVANPASATVARWANVVLVPGIVVFIGVVVWQRRRRRSARIQAIFSEQEGDQV